MASGIRIRESRGITFCNGFGFEVSIANYIEASIVDVSEKLLKLENFVQIWSFNKLSKIYIYTLPAVLIKRHFEDQSHKPIKGINSVDFTEFF